MEKVAWGVLGNAWIARDFVIPALRLAKNARFAAIASRGIPDAALYADARRYTGYEALLADPEIKVVYVPLPNALHCEWSIRAMEHGKHVLCEKPMAMDSAECARMIDAAEHNHVLLMEAFMYRFGGRQDKVMDVVKSGVLGEIRSVSSHHGYTLNWESPVRQSPALGGGSLYDVGCYCVDFMNQVMKTQNAYPIAADATCRKEGGVDVHMAGCLRYTNGVCSTVESWFDAAAHQQIRIIGTRGALLVEVPFELEPTRMTLVTPEGSTVTEFPEEPSYVREVEVFSEAVLGGEDKRMPLTDSLRNAQAMDMLLAAMRR